MYTEYERNGFMDHVKIALLTHCKKILSRFVITTYFLLSNQLYNNLFS